jgi:Protein of unknown function (DUF2971)
LYFRVRCLENLVVRRNEMNDAIFPTELSLALDDFGHWSDEHLIELQGDTKITQPLYHYTGAAGLLGIITSQQLWFTNYLHLNDPRELRYGMGIARRLLLEAGERFADNLIDLFTATAVRLCRDENLDGRLDFYVASFSRDRDDLGQWRSYADDGQGFALGLAPHLFHVDEKTDRKPHEHVFVMPVVYGEGQALSQYREAIDAAADIVQDNRGLLTNIIPQVQVLFMEELAKELIARELIGTSLTVKDEAYSHEKEVRLVILGMQERLRPYVTYRTQGSEIVPFIKSDMPVQEKGNISEIVIGPAAAPTAKDGIRSLLHSFHDDAESLITKSEISYRHL